MFTRPSSTGNYVASKQEQTHSGMLHQSRTLEGHAADKRRDKRETGVSKAPAKGPKLAGNMVEVSGAPAAPVTGENGRKAADAAKNSRSGRKSGVQPRVFVLGKNKRPLAPCEPARARQLLRGGRAVIHRLFPFTIRLKDRKTGDTQPMAVKLDPGASHTGAVLVRIETKTQGTVIQTVHHVLFAMELDHRGSDIRDGLTQRRGFRRSRRGRKTRYRAPRFNNRTRPKGRLPPSLDHRVETIMSWVGRFRRWAPVTNVAVESVRFDTQKLQDPEVSGIEYQRGELDGMEVREYVFEKWGRKCAYCDKEHLPLNLDHIVPKSRGGSDRPSNLVPACVSCNEAKDNLPIGEFLANQPKRLAKILAETKRPLAPAAAVNAARNELARQLRGTGLPVETATGGRTKWNRTRFGLPKTHAMDAACVGAVDQVRHAGTPALNVRCTGRGSRKRTRLTKDGFPRGYLSPKKSHFGFRTGDIVRAVVPSGKKRGTHFGRVAVRALGNFNIQTARGTVQGICYRHCVKIQRADGYAYNQT